MRVDVRTGLTKISGDELQRQVDRLATRAEYLVEQWMKARPSVFATTGRAALIQRVANHLLEGFRDILAEPGRGPAGTVGRTIMRQRVNQLLMHTRDNIVPELAREVFADEFHASLQREWDALMRGDITPAEWEARTQEHITYHYRLAYQLGKDAVGEPTDLTSADGGFLGGTIADERRYLRRFREELEQAMESGEEIGGRWQWRLDLYKQATHGLYEAAIRRYSDWVDWVLDPTAEHCPHCPQLAAESPWHADLLPTYPGQGYTDCLTQCRCHLEPIPIPNNADVEYDRQLGWLAENWPMTKLAKQQVQGYFTDDAGNVHPMVTREASDDPGTVGDNGPRTARMPRGLRDKAASEVTAPLEQAGFSAQAPRMVDDVAMHSYHNGSNGISVMVDSRRPPQGHALANMGTVAKITAALPRSLASAIDEVRVRADAMREPDAEGRWRYTNASYHPPRPESIGDESGVIQLFAHPATSDATTDELSHAVGYALWQKLAEQHHPIIKRWRKLFAASVMGRSAAPPAGYGSRWMLGPEEDFAHAFSSWIGEHLGLSGQPSGKEYLDVLRTEGPAAAADWKREQEKAAIDRQRGASLSQWSEERAALLEALWSGESDPFATTEVSAEPQGDLQMAENYAGQFASAVRNVPEQWEEYANVQLAATGDALMSDDPSVTGYNLEGDVSRYDVAPTDYSRALTSGEPTVVYHQYMQHKDHGKALLQRAAMVGLDIPYYVTTMGSTVEWDSEWDDEPEMTYETLPGGKLVGRSVQYAIVWVPETEEQAAQLADFLNENATASSPAAVERSWYVPDVRIVSESQPDSYEQRVLNMISHAGDQDLMVLSREEKGDGEHYPLWLNPELAEFVKCLGLAPLHYQRERGTNGVTR